MEFIKTHFWESIIAIPFTIWLISIWFGKSSNNNSGESSSGGGIVEKVKSKASNIVGGGASSPTSNPENKPDSK